MRGCCESTSAVYRAQLAERDAQIAAARSETNRLKESLHALVKTVLAWNNTTDGED